MINSNNPFGPGTDADCFLRLLGDWHTFQLFDDAGQYRKELTRVLHGTRVEHAETLARLNARGAGVFVTVNATDGRGRKTTNITRVRSLFCDLDGAPLEPLQAAPLKPHVIVQSSPGRWHGYWLVADCPLDDFSPLQKKIAARFNGDATICDLARVMRLPGSIHRKGNPFVTHIVSTYAGGPYSVLEFRSAFGFGPTTAPRKMKRALPSRIPEGERNTTLFKGALGFVRQGFATDSVKRRIQKINTERCAPPLCDEEVDTIAARASAYGSDGFAILPHRLLDSPEWRGLSPAAHDVILAAYRAYNGNNSEKIALTWADFKGRPGFGTKATFYAHRRAAVEVGILVRTSEGMQSQNGRKPDLFAIATKWLREISPGPKVEPCASSENAYPYRDKQSLEGSCSTSPGTRTLRRKIT